MVLTFCCDVFCCLTKCFLPCFESCIEEIEYDIRYYPLRRSFLEIKGSYYDHQAGNCVYDASGMDLTLENYNNLKRAERLRGRMRYCSVYSSDFEERYEMQKKLIFLSKFLPPNLVGYISNKLVLLGILL